MELSERFPTRNTLGDPRQAALGHAQKANALRQMGFSGFRTGQEAVVNRIMTGKDVICILATGGGKSACFVVPSLCLDWATIVFSPLQALMRDQVRSLQEKGIRAGRVSGDQNDTLNAKTLELWMRGECQFMFVAPERMHNPQFQHAIKIRPCQHMVVDECFPPDVEILTEDGWVRFGDLVKSTRVAQVDPDTQVISFVIPDTHIQNPYKGKLTRIKSDRLCDLSMTPGHELLVKGLVKGWHKQAVCHVKFGNRKRMAAAGFGEGGDSDKLTARERLLIAYQADGNLHTDRAEAGLTTMAFSFSRKRKIRRFLELMGDGGFHWNEVADREGRTRYLVQGIPGATKMLKDHFNLVGMGQERARAFVAEAVEWDGSKINPGLHYYSSTVGTNTDFVQAACVLAGYKTNKTIQEDHRQPQYKDVHRLFINLKTHEFDTQQLRKSEEDYDGEVYCVRVPKGCIVVRRNGKPVVVGNCHCLSTWSLTFRESYRYLGDFVREQNPPVVSAFTATLPEWAEQEVREVLGLQNAVSMNYYSRRDNLNLQSRMYPGDEKFIKFLFEETEGAVLVYFYSIKRLEDMAKTMRDMRPSEVTYYHGELGDVAKTNNMSAFMSGRARICLATSAFGMGIDKGDIRWVIHRDIPGTPEDLAQQCGRAGRDDKPSTCVLFFDKRSVSIQEFMIMVGSPAEDTVRHVFDTIERKCRLAGGVASLNTNDIAIASGLDRDYEASKQIPACVRILAASRVIDRQEEKDTTARVRFLEITSASKPFIQTREAILRLGVELPDGRIEFDLDVVAVQGIDHADSDTLKSRLRQWRNAQWIDYEPPIRIRPMKVVGHIEMVPWMTIREERKKAESKLAAVVAYAHLDDAKKQGFLENELGSIRGALTS